MALSPEVMRGLQHELVRLENERKKLDSTIASIRVLLGQGVVQQADGNGPKEAPGGFRDGIRAVLKAAGRPLQPREVAAEIQNRGYTGADAANLAVRVSNDLWKLKETGELKKVGRAYALVQRPDGGRQE